MMRTRLYALALLATFSLAGCLPYQNPLTDKPSKDLNTWLLGVWEHKDEAGKTYRTLVLPLSADRYTIRTRQNGSSKIVEFEAWISRVGHSKFLNMKSLTNSKELPEGAFIFAHYQVLDQWHIVTRPLQLESPEDSSSKALRAEIRTKIKDRSLLPAVGTVWTRVSDVYWKSDEASPGEPLIPMRLPEGKLAPPESVRDLPEDDEYELR